MTRSEAYRSIIPLVVLRISFGLVICVTQLRTLLKGWVNDFYVEPGFHFHFYGFEWLPFPSDFHLYALFMISIIAALGVLFGFLYKESALVLFMSFTYIELLDPTYYLNHYYFLILLALLMIVLPADRFFSLDARRKWSEKTRMVPNWAILAPRVLVGGLYFMAGLAKLNSDWLIEALPLRIWLPQFNELPLVGPLMAKEATAYIFSWAGAAFDLSVPFLLWKRSTRPFAYIALVLFHVITGIIFPIGMFPLAMILLTLVFFEEVEWRKLFPRINSERAARYSNGVFQRFRKPVFAVLFFLLFLFPFRFALYPDGLFWHEQGYRFSWRVMLMEKAGQAFFYVKDPQQPGKVAIANDEFLTPGQEKQMSTQPDLILQFAHHLDEHFKTQGIDDPEVYVESWVSLNGEGSRLFIDPLIDLSSVQDNWGHKEWVLPVDSIVAPNTFR